MTRKAIARRQWLFEYNCICWGKLTDHPSGMFAVRGSAGKGFLLPTFLFLKKKSTEEKYG